MQHIDRTIEELKVKIAEKERELAEMKKTVNQLCKLARHSPVYPTESESENVLTGLLRGDEYYMQPIAKVIGLILEKRKISGAGPATVQEIYDAMKAGGYKFDSKDDENAMRGISISMSKNVAKFHKLPSGKFGLTEWYPELKGKPSEYNQEKPKKIIRRRRKRKKSKQTEAKIEPPKKRGRPRKNLQPSEKPKETTQRRRRPKKSDQPENKQEESKE